MVDADILRLAAGPACFELTSPDPAALDRARVVLGPWLNGAFGPHPPRARFRVEAHGSEASGRWRVTRDGQEAAIVDSLDLALAAVEYRATAELLDPETGVVALHAALLSKGGRGVLLVGPKEAGKSTLACALWRSGWQLHSDDSARIEDGHRALGIPRRVSLRAASRDLLGAELWERIAYLPATTRTSAGLLFHPGEMSPCETPAGVQVTAVMFLARRGSTAGAAEAERLDAGRALLALGPYCHRRDAGIGGALQALQPLADRVPAYDLGRGDLAAMVQRIEEVVAT
jgi:hypothetical protein